MIYLPIFENSHNVDFYADKTILNSNLDDFLDGISEVSTKDTSKEFLKTTIAGELMHKFNKTPILDSKEMMSEYIYQNLRKGRVLEEAQNLA
jgi:hypothetical protein